MNEEQPPIRTKVLVREVMNSPAITASSNETVKDLAIKMNHYKVGCIVITESDEPIGIVTDGDITLKAVAKDLKPSQVLAKEIMSSPIRMIDSNKDITEASRVMRKLRIKKLGVNYRNRLVGIITMSDIVAVVPEIMEITSEKARIVSGEARRKSKYLSGYCDICNQWSDYLVDVDGKFQCEECREGKQSIEESL